MAQFQRNGVLDIQFPYLYKRNIVNHSMTIVEKQHFSNSYLRKPAINVGSEGVLNIQDNGSTSF